MFIVARNRFSHTFWLHKPIKYQIEVLQLNALIKIRSDNNVFYNLRTLNFYIKAKLLDSNKEIVPAMRIMHFSI